MDCQKIFETVVTAVIKQNKKSGIIDDYENFKCLYQDPTGCKCAIGHILPKNHKILKDNPNVTVDKLASSFKDLIEYWKLKEGDYSRNLAFLEKLQNIHDWVEIPYWKVKFRMLGLENDLNVDFIDSLVPNEV